MSVRFPFFAFLLAVSLPALAQDVTPAIDPTVAAQGALIQGTMQGHADRGHARQRGGKAGKAVSDECMTAWKLHDRMTRAERLKLYDLCPR